MADNFFDIDHLKKVCIRTLLKTTSASGGQTGKILSEGCFEMEIINQSKSAELTLKIKGEIIVLQAAFDQNPTPAVNLVYHKLVLRGEPYLVRSDEIEFSWSDPSATTWNMLVVRHCVVPFQEATDVNSLYPVYKR